MIRTVNLTGPLSRSAGGLFDGVRRLAQELSAPDLESPVLGISDSLTKEDLPAWNPVPVQAFRVLGPTQFGYSPGYERFLRLYHPDLLHTHGLWMYSSIAALRYASRTGVPLMVSPHGMLDPWAVRNSVWKKRIAGFFYERKHLRRASCLRALCESEAVAFRSYGLRNPICIIPNGIDLPYPEGMHSDFPRRGGDPKILLFLGRVHSKKGLPNALRALAEVLKSGGGDSRSWKLVIAGWDQGGHEEDLMLLCRELGLGFARRRGAVGEFTPEALLDDPGVPVLFFGPAYGETKRALLESAAAFILPSFSEGVPMSVLEAWAHKLPVVMTPECNLPEGYVKGAALSIGTDPRAIADGLKELFSMSARDRLAMGERGYELVKSAFTWKSVASRMREVYDWMLGGGSSPQSLCQWPPSRA
jgi:poly(glycerol-phosphate) alpha-glucosyltransferase